MFKSLNDKRGVSLYFAIIILTILLAIALGLGTILISQSRMVREMGDSTTAFYGAETGLERILYEDKLCRQPGCSSLTWPCLDTVNCDKGRLGGSVSDSLGQATYQVIFNNGATDIISIGMYKSTRRAIQVSR